MTTLPGGAIIGGASPASSEVTDCLYPQDDSNAAVIGVPTFQLSWGLCQLLPTTAYGAPIRWDIIARHFSCKTINSSPALFFHVPCAATDARYLGGPGYQFSANGYEFEVTATKGESSL